MGPIAVSNLTPAAPRVQHRRFTFPRIRLRSLMPVASWAQRRRSTFPLIQDPVSQPPPAPSRAPDYARAVHRASLITATDEEIEQRVKVRMARQELLTSPDAPQAWLVLNEAVIRRVIGGHAVMHAQLARLAEASASLPNITLQVVPFDAGAHASMDGSFNILAFPDPSDPIVVYLEYHTGALYLEKPQETARYRLIFDYLRAAALSVDASRALIASVAGELA